MSHDMRQQAYNFVDESKSFQINNEKRNKVKTR